jgi:hypothetical protein
MQNHKQMHLDHSISLRICDQAREMSGRGAAQLKGLSRMSKCQENSPRAGQHIYIEVPLRKEPLGTLRGLSHHRQTPCPRLSHTIVPYVLKLRILNGRFRSVERVCCFCPRRLSLLRTLSRKDPRPFSSQQTRPVNARQTHPSVCRSRARPSTKP